VLHMVVQVRHVSRYCMLSA